MSTEYKFNSEVKRYIRLELTDALYICILYPDGHVTCSDKMSNIIKYNCIDEFMNSKEFKEYISDKDHSLADIKCSDNLRGDNPEPLVNYLVKVNDSTETEPEEAEDVVDAKVEDEAETMDTTPDEPKEPILEAVTTNTSWDANERTATTSVPKEHYENTSKAFQKALEETVGKQLSNSVLTVKLQDTQDSSKTTLNDYRDQVATVIDTEKFKRYTFTKELNDKLLRTARRDKALLLSGTPGGGKTTWARYLAYQLTNGAVTSDRIEMIQFSASTSYSNFMEGFSANEKGYFELTKSVCLRLCDRAIKDKDNTYVLVIDEINRCRVADALGEFLNMVEARGEYVRTNNGLMAVMPENIIIIATMNTFDSGASELPYALRTRFAEYEITGQDVDVRQLVKGKGASDELANKAARIWEMVKKVNEFIFVNKKTHAYEIGPRPFSSEITSTQDLRDIVESRILKDIKIVLKQNYNNNTVSDTIAKLEKFVCKGVLDDAE